MTTRNTPGGIAQKDWDYVDSPPLTEEELAGMRPLRQVFPDLAEYAAKHKQRPSERPKPKVP